MALCLAILANPAFSVISILTQVMPKSSELEEKKISPNQEDMPVGYALQLCIFRNLASMEKYIVLYYFRLQTHA